MSSPSEGIQFDYLRGIINTATQKVKMKLEALNNVGSAVSISDMFEMQMLMNHLSQLSEMSTGVLAAMNTSVSSMARNVKA
jgi:hypothetical protein